MEPKVVSSECPRCDGARYCEVHGHFDEKWSWDDGEHSQSGESAHSLLRCRGCETVFYHLSASSSEDWDGRYNALTGEEEIFFPKTVSTYPPPQRKLGKPDWIWGIGKKDLQLGSILDEVYEARESGLLILASVGLRTGFDRCAEMLGIDSSLSLARKVETLVSAGHVGEKEAEALRIVVDAGSAAAHRAWSPTSSEFESLLSSMETFLHRVFVVPPLDVIREGIPARPSRKGI